VLSISRIAELDVDLALSLFYTALSMPWRNTERNSALASICDLGWGYSQCEPDIPDITVFMCFVAAEELSVSSFFSHHQLA